MSTIGFVSLFCFVWLDAAAIKPRLQVLLPARLQQLNTHAHLENAVAAAPAQ